MENVKKRLIFMYFNALSFETFGLRLNCMLYHLSSAYSISSVHLYSQFRFNIVFLQLSVNIKSVKLHLFILLTKVAAEWLLLSLRISQIRCSNYGPEISCGQRVTMVFFSPSRRIPG
jgi:hypothetical protein